MLPTNQSGLLPAKNWAIGLLAAITLAGIQAPVFAGDSISTSAGVISVAENEAVSEQGFAYKLIFSKPLWPNATLLWYYNPAHKPSGTASDEQIIERMKQAARKWMDACKINIVYMGTTTAEASVDTSPSARDQKTVVGWRTLPKYNGRAVTYQDYLYAMQEADTVLNTEFWKSINVADLDLLEGGMTRSFGFMIGLDKSDKSQSVMNQYEDDATPAFQRTLKADDIAGCVALYGARPSTNTTRVFNWIESLLESMQNVVGKIGPVGRTTEAAYGGFYRYFPEGNAYLGELNGTVYYWLPGGQITPLGALNDLLSLAAADGF